MNINIPVTRDSLIVYHQIVSDARRSPSKRGKEHAVKKGKLSRGTRQPVQAAAGKLSEATRGSGEGAEGTQRAG